MVATFAAAALLLVGAASAGGSVTPRSGHPGPALSTPPAKLAAALSCPRRVRQAREPVLLVPGAGGDPISAFAGLAPVLRAKGYPVCRVSLPDAGFGDAQVQAEYVVASIRRVATRSRRQVGLIAVSAGGPVLRWALKWWPDLRSMVADDVIGVAPANHGIGGALVTLCGIAPCAPASRQLLSGSQFLAALNRGDETPGRLAYSVIASTTDVDVPSRYSPLEGERDDSNTVVQRICTGRNVDHGEMVYDSISVALVVDALRYDGPARASRISETKCRSTYAGGVNPATVQQQLTEGRAFALANYARAGLTSVEPKLRWYAR